MTGTVQVTERSVFGERLKSEEVIVLWNGKDKMAALRWNGFDSRRAYVAGRGGLRKQIADGSEDRNFAASGSYVVKYEDMQKVISKKATLERTDM